VAEEPKAGKRPLGGARRWAGEGNERCGWSGAAIVALSHLERPHVVGRLAASALVGAL
jgi:hypothetical protein